MPSRLADYPFDIVRLACQKCPRKGQYRKATPIERYRPDQNMVEVSAESAGRTLSIGKKLSEASDEA